MAYLYIKDVRKEKMGIYQKIVIIIAIILGIFSTIFVLSSDVAQMAFNNPTTEEDYVFLEETAIKLIKNHSGNILTGKEFSFGEGELTISANSEKASVDAIIPIVSQELDVKGEAIEYSAMLDFENVKYERENLLRPAYSYILLSIVEGLLSATLVYCTFYLFWHKNRIDKK